MDGGDIGGLWIMFTICVVFMVVWAVIATGEK